MQSGILFLDKEAGLTSRKVDNTIGRYFHTKKVGHLGTLDPFATGLLIIGVNAGNKALRFARDEEKEYEATLKLGVSTDTGDLTGVIQEEQPVPALSQSQIETALASLLGKQIQIPPMTSAIKVDGVALYKLAHQGKEIERQGREIEVYESQLLGVDASTISFRVKVSKGTYIRTLGEELARRLGTIGHLIALRRTAIGPFRVENAQKLDEIDENSLQNPLQILGHMERFELDENSYPKALNGVKLSLPSVAQEVLLTYRNQAIAVYEKDGEGVYHSLRGLF